MEYPHNGSIAIIDDKFQEVEGLIRVLSNKKIPVTYFNGMPDEITCLHGIRIVFLDLDLKIGVRDAKESDIISNAFSNLRMLVPKNNGGYILIIWSSRTSEYAPIVKERIISAKEKCEPLLNEYPLEILHISKHEVATLIDNTFQFDLDKIKLKIDSKIQSNNFINIITLWENNVIEASKKVVTNFSEISDSEDEKKRLLAIFADSTSRFENLNNDNIILASLNPLSHLLNDHILSISTQINHPEIGAELIEIVKSKGKLTSTQVANLNTFYHVDKFSQSSNHEPGSVYKYMDYMDQYSCSSKECNTKWSENLIDKVLKKLEIPTSKFDKDFTEQLLPKSIAEIIEHLSNERSDLLIQLNKIVHNNMEKFKDQQLFMQIKKDNDKKDILKNFYKDNEASKCKNSIKNQSIPIFLEFSPSCDFVQGKRKKLRLVFGLLIPHNFEEILQYEKKLTMLKISGDNIITAPLINYEKVTYQVVFDMHTVTGINEEAFHDMKSIFRFRKELVVDIQQKIATHISRPGFFNMNDYLAN